MARVKGGNVSKNRRRKVLKEAKGYFGSKHRLYKTAQEQLFHSGAYAYRDRKQNKRNFRKLWITRINAACRENNISYSKFINGLTKAGISINRKMLSEMAIDDAKSFASLVETAKKALNGEVVAPKKVEAKVEEKEVKKEEKKEVAKETEDLSKKTLAELKALAKDKNLNNIPLRNWDRWAGFEAAGSNIKWKYDRNLRDLFRAKGITCYSPSQLVSTLKQAARRYAEEN